MKKSLVILFTILSLSCLSQSLNQISKEDIIKRLEGNWVKKNDNSNKVFHYSFYEGKGWYKELEKNETESNRIEIKSFNPTIRLRKSIFGYKIEYISMFGSKKSKIKYLDTEKMILKTDGELIEYRKLTAANSGYQL
jgi:hypothetical protein